MSNPILDHAMTIHKEMETSIRRYWDHAEDHLEKMVQTYKRFTAMPTTLISPSHKGITAKFQTVDEY